MTTNIRCVTWECSYFCVWVPNSNLCIIATSSLALATYSFLPFSCTKSWLYKCFGKITRDCGAIKYVFYIDTTYNKAPYYFSAEQLIYQKYNQENSFPRKRRWWWHVWYTTVVSPSFSLVSLCALRKFFFAKGPHALNFSLVVICIHPKEKRILLLHVWIYFLFLSSFIPMERLGEKEEPWNSQRKFNLF